MFNELMRETEKRMEKALEATKEDLNTIRTGRARPSLVENIKANNYGVATPIQQMAKVMAPEARQIVIEPWDKNNIEAIEKAIMQENLGLNPSNDGNVIRINIPQLTEERRKELSKILHKKAEDGKIAIRNIRRDANEELEMLEDEGEISEDNMHRGFDNVQELTDEYIGKIEAITERKENEIMEV
ncbi:ribosome recycling factor [Halanaerobium sp. Z-7514]|uniref:Ribosome-recycling factor n=1 Tax=Halanaerobium polyolivorans TaxID=2886943 RepID=A0AAW4WXY9_9FIRM|nr:ribosome recycling factor [Halanaerobium polyolivorans]MCC3143824.1 ribosome recycling factor [Halanaerobium polyolivorans]RQD75797.1 MAG: ribosome recycling factor [Halanaerobium sp. MSAO_Bac5]